MKILKKVKSPNLCTIAAGKMTGMVSQFKTSSREYILTAVSKILWTVSSRKIFILNELAGVLEMAVSRAVEADDICVLEEFIDSLPIAAQDLLETFLT